MTLAVCIACGCRKFGAFTPCPNCAFVPASAIEKAKSIMLSDHDLSADQLDQFGKLIQSGEQIPYDPVSLADSAEAIAEEEYFQQHFDPERGVLQCAQCARLFTPRNDETLCFSCGLQLGENLSVCRGCVMLYESTARYCQNCDRQLERGGSMVSARSVGRRLALTTRRIVTTTKFWEICRVLGQRRGSLVPVQQAVAEAEFENLAMYAATLVLGEMCPSTELAASIVKAMLNTYRKAWVIQGSAPDQADGFVELCIQRFEGYRSAALRYPDKPSFGVAETAVRNCVCAEKDLEATLEMMAGFAMLVKTLRSVLGDKVLG